MVRRRRQGHLRGHVRGRALAQRGPAPPDHHRRVRGRAGSLEPPRRERLCAPKTGSGPRRSRRGLGPAGQVVHEPARRAALGRVAQAPRRPRAANLAPGARRAGPVGAAPLRAGPAALGGRLRRDLGHGVRAAKPGRSGAGRGRVCQRDPRKTGTLDRRPRASDQALGPRYEPAGIAAISRGWQPRLAAAGTFDDAWRRERFPLLPLDFDVAHFQIAPPDQRFAELDPGTPILATNMSASGLFRARVPPPPPPVWFCFEDRTLERAVTLDTLVVEPGAGVLLACWRTAVPLGRSPDQLREVRIGANPMSVAAPVGRRRKPHFRSLGEAVAWARRQRKARRR